MKKSSEWVLRGPNPGEFEANFGKLREEGGKLLERFQKGDHGDVVQKACADWVKRCPNCSGASPTMGIE